MTALLAIENCQMDEPVTVTRTALNTVSPGSSIAGLQNGEVLTMYQMLECLLVASGNDAAAVIAAHVGGSVEKFVEMMNTRSDELGCTSTHYMNPSGLHDEKPLHHGRGPIKGHGRGHEAFGIYRDRRPRTGHHPGNE